MISVGIDISKEKSMVCILKPYGELIAEPYEIKHTDSDLKLLVETILEFKEETRVVMEATGQCRQLKKKIVKKLDNRRKICNLAIDE